MARTHTGIPSKRMTMRINGATRPAIGGTDFEVRVDGVAKSWVVESGSHHAATFQAAIEAMIHAHAAGITHLTLQTPNDDVRRLATGEWDHSVPDLARMHADYLVHRADFDDVDWTRGPE